MKILNVYVPEDKIKFVRELLDGLGLEWDFGKNMGADSEVKEEQPLPYELDEEARMKAAKVREESLKDVISRIEQMRQGKH